VPKRPRIRGNGDGDVWPRRNTEGRVIGYQGSVWVNGKRIYRSAKTKAEARAALASVKSEASNPTTAYANKNLTLADYLTKWLEDTVKPTAAANTYMSYERQVRLHINPEIGDIRLADLRPADIRRLYVLKHEEGKSRGSIETMRIALRSALSQAARDKLIPENPTSGVKIPGEKRDADEQGMHPLSADEVRRLLEVARGSRFELAILFGVHLGLRVGEIMGLRWEDVDLERGTLDVRRQLQRNRDGSGGYSFPPPKRDSTRKLDIPAPVVAAIDSYRDRLKREGVIPAGLLFTTKTGKPFDPDSLTKRYLRPLLVKAGLPLVSFHDLRHSFATLHLANGTDVKTLQQMLGHKSAAITLDTYSHFVPQKGREAADRMAAILG
jgi:integrase